MQEKRCIHQRYQKYLPYSREDYNLSKSIDHIQTVFEKFSVIYIVYMNEIDISIKSYEAVQYCTINLFKSAFVKNFFNQNFS